MSKVKKNGHEDFLVKEKESGLSKFITRPVPNEDEVKSFEKFAAGEKRETEINEHLNAIYQDQQGEKINIGAINKKRGRGFAFWFFSLIFLLAIGGGIFYGFYYSLNNTNKNQSKINLEIKAPEQVAAGEEFTYTINYKNNSQIGAHDAVFILKYPDGFILLESSVATSTNDFTFNVGQIASRGSGELKLKGKLIAKKGDTSVLFASLSYYPDNFSSEFKAEGTKGILISEAGFNAIFDYSNAALLGQENQVKIKIKPSEKLYFNDFSIKAEVSDTVDLSSLRLVVADKESKLTITKVKEAEWAISGFSAEIGEANLNLFFKVKSTENLSDQALVNLRFLLESKTQNQQLLFLEKEMPFLIMKSDLNLSILVNGSKSNKAINFGEILNYSIEYNNLGQSALSDVMVVALIEADLLDWSTLSDQYNGEKGEGRIVWTKDNIPALAEIGPGQSGSINFSIKVKDFVESDITKRLSVSSYAKYVLGTGDDGETENKSNTIVNLLNSDLSLDEQIRYFNEDNVVVGSGPLPPQVGENTNFKVYWTVKNNIHELNNTRVSMDLPDYVSWVGAPKSSVGDVYYDSNNHRIIWELGRLPISVYRSDAEFNISIRPNSSDRNKVLVISSGTRIEALDAETNDTLNKTVSAKTTRLEDDDIANINNDGRIR